MTVRDPDDLIHYGIEDDLEDSEKCGYTIQVRKLLAKSSRQKLYAV